MPEPRGQELISRYKLNYGMSNDAPITEDMILCHWDLEKRLRQSLLASTLANRWEVFERCYAQLYTDLPWLNNWTAVEKDTTLLSIWRNLIGPPPQNVYEVGSGKGELMAYLATQGYRCRATEITRERGKKWGGEHPNLSWAVTDGIHLDAFEPVGTYDIVISDQLIEHLHPDDLLIHFNSVHAILRENGRYMLSTPHKASGPHDVSRVFRCNEPMGMHLKEYTYGELKSLLGQAGFECYGVLKLPVRVRRLLRNAKPVVSRGYLQYLMIIETILANIRPYNIRFRVVSVSKMLLYTPNIMIVALKR